MTCNDLSDLFENWAAGETPSPEVQLHVNGCAACTSRLALARTLDRLLASADMQTAPPQFSQNVMRRLRHDWWQAEESLDTWFNWALGMALLVVLAGIWLLYDRSGLTAIVHAIGTFMILGVSAMVRQLAPSLPLYFNATIILIVALLVWRWTEGELL